MKRRTFLAAPALVACGKSKRLNVFNWSDYIGPSTIRNFESEFGVTIRYGVYESAEEMLARVMSGNSGWDVVFPSNAFIEPMREMSLLASLDHARLPTLGELDAPFHSPQWDPKLKHCVPYMWGATGIAYQATVTPLPSRWADLWDQRFRGRVTMLDDPAEVFAACLKKIGRSVNSTDESQLAAAKAEAISQKRLLRAYLNAEARDQLIAGDLLAAQAWRLTAQQAIKTVPGKLAFAYPAEGFPIYADCAAILRESTRQDLAHQFLDYLLRPSVAAEIADAMSTATCNRGARRLLQTPQEDVPAGGEWFTALPSAAQRMRDRLWTEIKSA